jgi:hypothetical protein
MVSVETVVMAMPVVMAARMARVGVLVVGMHVH